MSLYVLYREDEEDLGQASTMSDASLDLIALVRLLYVLWMSESLRSSTCICEGTEHEQNVCPLPKRTYMSIIQRKILGLNVGRLNNRRGIQ